MTKKARAAKPGDRRKRKAKPRPGYKALRGGDTSSFAFNDKDRQAIRAAFAGHAMDSVDRLLDNLEVMSAFYLPWTRKVSMPTPRIRIAGLNDVARKARDLAACIKNDGTIGMDWSAVNRRMLDRIGASLPHTRGIATVEKLLRAMADAADAVVPLVKPLKAPPSMTYEVAYTLASAVWQELGVTATAYDSSEYERRSPFMTVLHVCVRAWSGTVPTRKSLQRPAAWAVKRMKKELAALEEQSDTGGAPITS